ncbi:MAG TPA: hypothetical protein VNR51_10455 [Hyphomicrobium sp.]|nr:hypothetical protein [Hyphomicrobium sp.]
MRTKTTISVMAAVLALGGYGTAALAQDGLPGDPNSTANTIPAPNPITPSDPSANDTPPARIPTTSDGFEVLRESYSVGTSAEVPANELPASD